jgi:hypothetical protein
MVGKQIKAVSLGFFIFFIYKELFNFIDFKSFKISFFTQNTLNLPDHRS